MCAITPSNELFSHAKADEVTSTPLNQAKASHQNLFSQPANEDALDAVAPQKPLPRNPFQV
ncbi:hypothetical protein [Actinocrispum sp. NPDC049592]|uniref:hypothetical protein n=1 Tax=Actinocrispum sp. NPDC049592 TaxID=3154835 RepID=UPI00341A6DFC